MSMVMLTADLALSFGIDLLPAAAIAPRAMVAALVLSAAATMWTLIHCTAEHSTLLGLLIRSLADMLANANLKDTVLIGARLAYAVVDLFSAMRRDATQSLAPVFRQAVLCCRVEAQ